MSRAMLLFTTLFVLIGAIVYFMTNEEIEYVSGDVLLEDVDLDSLENVRIERHNIDSDYRYETAEIENEELMNTLFQSINQSTLQPLQGDIFGLSYVMYFEVNHRQMSLRFSENYITSDVNQQAYQFEDNGTLIETLESFDITWEPPQDTQN
ncbi:hypothetical protein [Alkalibacillus salilacus]|uniref:DUF4860 domain-containing protein n=1 Tax=Alkalibacillus salilacus TaxID=284582 RepID=A0ABT9VH10_9BACI|nr:hypothetical protein [Alkalibacillus salilacus]MDQ0160204.1 hypothetical protein [Alkalibacillus salilacus]